MTDKDHFIDFDKHSGMVNTKFKLPVGTVNFLQFDDSSQISQSTSKVATNSAYRNDVRKLPKP